MSMQSIHFLSGRVMGYRHRESRVRGAVIWESIQMTTPNAHNADLDRNRSDFGRDENSESIPESCIALKIIPNVWPDNLSNHLRRGILKNQLRAVDHARGLQSL